jgi:hypothetical protein
MACKHWQADPTDASPGAISSDGLLIAAPDSVGPRPASGIICWCASLRPFTPHGVARSTEQHPPTANRQPPTAPLAPGRIYCILVGSYTTGSNRKRNLSSTGKIRWPVAPKQAISVQWGASYRVGGHQPPRVPVELPRQRHAGGPRGVPKSPRSASHPGGNHGGGAGAPPEFWRRQVLLSRGRERGRERGGGACASKRKTKSQIIGNDGSCTPTSWLTLLPTTSHSLRWDSRRTEPSPARFGFKRRKFQKAFWWN